MVLRKSLASFNVVSLYLTCIPSSRYTKNKMKSNKVSSTTQISILNAACQIILERGAEALTIEAVAQKAGISKGGLLYHFPSKNKLIEGMINRLIIEGGICA